MELSKPFVIKEGSRDMTETDNDAADVILAYRKRRQRVIPLVLGGLAVVLLVVGVFFVVLWFTGDSPPAMPGFLATDTPTATVTHTPPPPTATATITNTPEPSLTPTPEGPITYLVEAGDTLSSIADQFGVEESLVQIYQLQLHYLKTSSRGRRSNTWCFQEIHWRRSLPNLIALPKPLLNAMRLRIPTP
jgi:hypothetical protein